MVTVRLPPLAQVLNRPSPVSCDGTVASFSPDEVVPVRVPGPDEPDRGDFLSMFSRLVRGEQRRKPSFSDTWMLEGSEGLVPLSSYTTTVSTVTIGLAPDGATEYVVVPFEYAYPAGLCRVAGSLVEDVRGRYRREGGPLDRNSVTEMCRDAVSARSDEIRSLCPEGTDTAGLEEDLCGVARRHSVGAGIFETLLADPNIEDVYVDAPCASNRIHVTVNGVGGRNAHTRCRTNLVADAREVSGLVNILLRDSGLRFCRSSPVLETDLRGFDTRATVIGYPLSPMGDAVALRRHSDTPWTLTRLVANGTVDPWTAGLLSFLVNNRCTILVCGPRGAGKSSLLSALMFEFPLDQRILTLEDTLELPCDRMRSMGYRVQSMLVDDRMGGDQEDRSADALRVALRMGESAIVLGEVRGEEASVLYRSMQVGRAGSSIMGTVHGDSPETVYRRMVDDAGVSPEAFSATDVVVTLGTVGGRPGGGMIRRVESVVSTCDVPGTFTAVTDGDSLFSSTAIGRVVAGRGRAEILREIGIRAAMRAELAGAGGTDPSFLGPGWVLRANTLLGGLPAGTTEADALAGLRGLMGVGD